MTTALVVGRFQPPHYGHIYLLHKALEVADRIVIAIGSSNVEHPAVDRKANPFTYQQRRAWMEQVVEEEGIAERVRGIVPSPDYPEDDARWLRELEEQVRTVAPDGCDVVVGNNDWVNSVLGNEGYAVHEVEMLRREELEGREVRARMRAHDPTWRDRVPEYLSSDIKTQWIGRTS